MPSLTCAGILFDLDGVLVDSTGSVERLWRRWGRQHNIDIDRLLTVAHGRRTSETIQLVAPHLNTREEVDRLEGEEAADKVGVAVMPGARELVASIPGGRWGIVTSGTRLLATARLSVAGIPVPGVLVTAESVTNGKPHPEPYLRGARLLGVSPEKCVVIEDAPAGIQAAAAAGMRVIALASTYVAHELEAADAVVSSLTRLRVDSCVESDLTLSWE